MVVLTTTQAVLLGVVLALWLGAALWAVVTGVTMRRAARDAVTRADEFDTLIGSGPAIPVRIGADGRARAPDALARLLGLPKVPRFVSDFAGSDAGLASDDTATLVHDIAAVQRNAGSFHHDVVPQGTTRSLSFDGAPATGGGAVVWVHDTTAIRAEELRLAREVERLRRAFDALSMLIEAAPVPMWHRDPELRLTLVNRAYVTAVDAHDADDAVARGLELVEASGGIGPIAAAAHARDAGEVQRRIVPATIAGQRRSLQVVDVPLGAAGVAGYALDNDELERSRADIRRFAETQRDTLDRLSAGVAQFAADRTLTFCNQPFQRLFGMKPEWLADRPEFDRVLDRMREAGRVPDVGDFPAWKAERRAWFTNAAGASEENWLLSGGMHLRVVAQPLPDGGLLAIFEDRTEQVQLASARDTLLRVREATFDNLFEAVGVFASDGRLHVWNNRFRDVWGFDDALLATHPRVDALAQAAAPMLTNPDRAALIRELVRAATLERKARSGRVAFKNGQHHEFAAVPLPDGNALLTMLDITDSRRIERALRDRAEALETADRVKSAFVANMSYQLRTPLTSIGGFAEMMKLGLAGELPPAARDYVDAILESVARLGEQVDDALAMTGVDAGVTAHDRETIDLVALLTALVGERADTVRARRQALISDIARDTPRYDGDPRALRAAVGALLDAAIADTPEGGRVLVHASARDTGAVIVISDNGSGRAGTRTDVDAARRLVADAGGSVELIAEPGEGSAVSIVLPR